MSRFCIFSVQPIGADPPPLADARAGDVEPFRGEVLAELPVRQVALQLSIGVFRVWRAFPVPLAAAHNAGAALLVAATVWLNRSLRPVPDFR